MEFIKKCGNFIKESYQKQWFMWVMLIFVCPIGIYLMFKYNKKYSKPVKIIISIFAILFMICGLASEDTTQVDNNNKPQEEIKEEIKENNKNEDKEEEKDKDNFFSTDDNQIETDSITTDFGVETTTKLRQLGFTVDEATSIYNIFVKIGINQIDDVKLGAGSGIDNLQSFVATANKDKKKKFYFTVEKRQLYYAGFLDDTLFDSTKGGVLKSIDDVHIPNTDVDLETYSKLQVLSQDLVKQYLKYPKTAKFPLYDSWGVGRRDDKYQVNGKVTAKNGFGVESEMDFSIWFIKKDNNFNVEAIVIDDTRVK